MIGEKYFTKEGKNVIEVEVRGGWTSNDKVFCRTLTDEPYVIIRSVTQLVSTKMAARKVKV